MPFSNASYSEPRSDPFSRTMRFHPPVPKFGLGTSRSGPCSDLFVFVSIHVLCMGSIIPGIHNSPSSTYFLYQTLSRHLPFYTYISSFPILFLHLLSPCFIKSTQPLPCCINNLVSVDRQSLYQQKHFVFLGPSTYFNLSYSRLVSLAKRARLTYT